MQRRAGSHRSALLDAQFDFNSVANLGLWLESTRRITLDTSLGSNTVSNWGNLANTGSAYDATQSSKSIQPTYGAGSLKGRPGVRFGSTKRMSFGGSGLSLCQNKSGVSIFAVIQSTSLSVAQNVVDFSLGDVSSDKARFLLGVDASNQIHFNGSSVDGLASFPPDLAGGTHTTDPVLLSATYDTSSQTVGVYQNSTQVASSTTYSTSAASFPNTASTSAELGDYIFYFSDPLVGDMFELLVFERALSTEERVSVMQVLRRKWGLVF